MTKTKLPSVSKFLKQSAIVGVCAITIGSSFAGFGNFSDVVSASKVDPNAVNLTPSQLKKVNSVKSPVQSSANSAKLPILTYNEYTKGKAQLDKRHDEIKAKQTALDKNKKLSSAERSKQQKEINSQWVSYFKDHQAFYNHKHYSQGGNVMSAQPHLDDDYWNTHNSDGSRKTSNSGKDSHKGDSSKDSFSSSSNSEYLNTKKYPTLSYNSFNSQKSALDKRHSSIEAEQKALDKEDANFEKTLKTKYPTASARNKARDAWKKTRQARQKAIDSKWVSYMNDLTKLYSHTHLSKSGKLQPAKPNIAANYWKTHNSDGTLKNQPQKDDGNGNEGDGTTGTKPTASLAWINKLRNSDPAKAYAGGAGNPYLGTNTRIGSKDHPIDGYLTFNDMTGKGQPFGDSANRWRKDGKHILYNRGSQKDTRKLWNSSYEHNIPDYKRGAGKIGMFYPNAGYYHPYNDGPATAVSFRITYMGGNNGITSEGKDGRHWNHTDLSMADGTYIAFSQNSLGVWDLGRGTDFFKFQILDAKTGKELKSYKGPLSFWDIDVGQGVLVDSSKYDIKYSNLKSSNSKNADAGPSMINKFTLKSNSDNKSKLHSNLRNVIQGIWTSQNRDRDQWGRDGTVDNDDTRGAFTSLLEKPSTIVRFSRYGTDISKGLASSSQFKPGKVHATKSLKTIKKDPNQYGYWFSIGSNIKPSNWGDNWDKDTKKYVSTESNKGHWHTKQLTVDSKKTFWYAIQTRVRWKSAYFNNVSRRKPLGTFKGQSGMVMALDGYTWKNTKAGYKPATKKRGAVMGDYTAISQLRFADYAVDPGLDVVGGAKGIKVWARTNKTSRNYMDITKNFAIKVSKGTAHKGAKVDVVLDPTKKAALKSAGGKDTIFNRTIDVVIPVKANKYLKFTKRDKKTGKLCAFVKNNAMVTKDSTYKVPWVKTKIEQGSTHNNVPAPPTNTRGQKMVFRQEPGSTKFEPMTSKYNYDGAKDPTGTTGQVFPGQTLRYRLAFKIPGLIQNDTLKQRYGQINITDTIDTQHLDMRTIKNVKIGTNPSNMHKYPFIRSAHALKLAFNRKSDRGKEILKNLKKQDNILYVYYDISVNNKDVTKPTKVVNSAQINFTSQYRKFETWTEYENSATDSGYDDYYTDDDDMGTPIFDSSDDDSVSEGKSVTRSEWHAYNQAKSFDKTNPSTDWAGKHRANAKTNQTMNWLIPESEPGRPDKKASWINADGKVDKNHDTSVLNHGEYMMYTITQPLNTLNADIGSKYKQVVLEDHIDKHLKVVSVQVISKDDGDVTSRGSLSKANNDVKWTASPSYLKKMTLNGGSLTMKIKVKYNRQQIKTTTIVNNTAENHFGSVDHNYPNLASNQVQTTLEGTPASMSKGIDSVTDERTNETGDSETIMKPNDPYTVRYHISVDTGNSYSMSGFTIRDRMPENVTVKKNPNIHVNAIFHDGYGKYRTADVTNDFKNQSSKNNFILGLMNGSSKYYFTTLDITFDTHVAPESDWSDFYNAKGKGSSLPGQVVNSDGNLNVDDNSYLKIPNTAYAQFGDDTEQGSGYFNMGAQTMHLKQVIVQDDDNWVKKLDPSHYVDHVRNDRTGVTTAVMLQMPNYMKLDKTKFDTSFIDPRFDKGETHILRVNSDVVHDPSKLINPDFTKNGFATTSPYLGVFPTDNLQKASGKTYYAFTKWAPMTKYYRDYARLKNMTANFKATFHLDAHSQGERHDQNDESNAQFTGKEVINHTYDNKQDDLNNVAIHLPNIYAYYDMIDRGTYGTGVTDNPNPKVDYNKFDDGSKMDYTLYGEVKGLAVDPSQVTDFSKEGQPITAWLKSSTYDAGKHTLKLKDGLKTGETAPVQETWTNIDASKLTGLRTDHGYYSQSNTYRDTKLDPYLGKNPEIAEKKGHSVTLTNVRTDHDETLIPSRKDDTINWEKYKKQVLNTANTLMSNPKVFIDYFDFNKNYGGKTMTRVLREAYELYAADSISAKAGYGIKDNHKFMTFTYYDGYEKGQEKNSNGTLNTYKTTVISPDKIFDDGYTTAANNEAMDQDFSGKRDTVLTTKADKNGVWVVDPAQEKLVDHDLQAGRNSNWHVADLIDEKTASKPMPSKWMTWASDNKLKVLPQMRLTNINYRFNQRVLKDGKQAYKMSENAYPSVNGNTVDDSKLQDATVGGYRNYLKSTLDNGKYKLNFVSIPFGVGKAITMNYNQNLDVFGHRMLAKNKGSNSSSEDELAIQPVISGNTVLDKKQKAHTYGSTKTAGLGKKGNDFVANNNPDQKWDN